MKYLTTKRAMKDRYHNVISISYCNAQHLLGYETPFAYSSGAYGWSCDYYEVDGVLISTGYSPISAKNTVADYAVIREYDEKAIELSDGKDYDERKAIARMLLSEFVEKAVV